MDYQAIINHLMKCCAEIETCSDDNADGRLSSAVGEKNILLQIKKYAEQHEIPIEISRHREWYDFKFGDIYFNLKMTSGGTDNIFNKIAVIYSVTGKIPENKNLNFDKFLEYVKTEKWKTSRDLMTEYHYLVYHKVLHEWTIVRLMDMLEYKPNVCNILQASWNKEFTNAEIDESEWNKKITRLLCAIQYSVKKDILTKLKFASYNFESNPAEDSKPVEDSITEQFASLTIADG